MKKAIVLVCFGSTNIEGLNNSVVVLKKEFEEKFDKDYKIFLAFTSKVIINILKEKKNIFISHISEVLNDLVKENYEEVIIKPLHLIVGKDFIELINIGKKYENNFKALKILSPLLDSEEFVIKKVSEVLIKNIKDDENFLIIGHGLKSGDDSKYDRFLEIVSKCYNKKVYFATIEGNKKIENTIIELKKDNIKSVVIKCIFMISGKHILDDIKGGENSIIYKLLKNDINLSINEKSLLEIKDIRRIFLDNM